MPIRRRGPLARAACLGAAAALAACSPTFDWRTVRPEGAPVEALFPCKPAVERRPVRLAGAERPMALHACAAGGVRFALAVVAVDDAARVRDVVGELRRSFAVNLGAAGDPAVRPWPVRGATPNPLAGRSALAGRGRDGAPAVAEVGLAVAGTTVLQAIAVGGSVPPDVAETFLSSFAVAGP